MINLCSTSSVPSSFPISSAINSKTLLDISESSIPLQSLNSNNGCVSLSWHLAFISDEGLRVQGSIKMPRTPRGNHYQETDQHPQASSCRPTVINLSQPALQATPTLGGDSATTDDVYDASDSSIMLELWGRFFEEPTIWQLSSSYDWLLLMINYCTPIPHTKESRIEVI